MRVQLKKFCTQITVLAVIFSSLGPSVFVALPAEAAVSTLAATAIASRNQVLGQSAPATALLGLNAVQTAGEQLSQVRVMIDPPRDANGNPTGTIAPTDFAALAADANSGVALYADNAGGGTQGVFDATDTVVPLVGAPSFNTNTQLVRLTPSGSTANAQTDTTLSLTDGDAVFTKTSTDQSYAWHIVKTGNGGTGGVTNQAVRLENLQTAPQFAANMSFSKFTPEATGNFTVNGTANTTQFTSGATPALSTGDIVLYSAGTTVARWGLVSGAFTATNAPVDGQNLANETYRMSRVAGVTGSYSVAGSGAITVTGALNAAALTVGDMVLYRDTSTNNQAQWGVVTNATLTSGLFAIDGLTLAPGTTATPKVYQISKLNAYVNATKLLTNNGDTNVTVGTVSYALLTSNADFGGAAVLRNMASWHMITTAGLASNADANLRLKLNNSAAVPTFGAPAQLLVTLAANALLALPANDTDADKVGPDFFVVMKGAATPAANNAFIASILSTYFGTVTAAIAPVATPRYTFTPTQVTTAVSAAQQLTSNTTLQPLSESYQAVKLNLAQSNQPDLRAIRVVVNPSGTGSINDLAPITNDATSGITLVKDNKADAAFRGNPDAGDSFVGNTYTGTNNELDIKRTLQSSQLVRMTPSATVTDNGNTADGVLAVNVGDAVFARVGAGSYMWHMATTAGNLSSFAAEGTAGLDGANAAGSLVAAGSQMSKLNPQNGTGTFTVGGEANQSTVNLAANDIIFYQTGTGQPKWDIVTSASAFDVVTFGTPLQNGTYRMTKFTPDANRPAYGIGDVVLYQNNSTFSGDTKFAIITGFDRDASDAVIGYTLSSGETVALARMVKFTGFGQLSKDVGATDYDLVDGDLVLAMPTLNPIMSTTDFHIVTTPNGGALGMNNAVRLNDIGAGAPRFDGTVVVLTPGTAGTIAADDAGNNAQADYFISVRTSRTAANGNAFTVSIAPDSLVLGNALQGVTMPSMSSLTSVIFTVSTTSSMTTNAASNIAGAPTTIAVSSNPTAVFGVNTVTSGADLLEKVTVTVNPGTGFVMSELNALGTNAQSGIALYEDNKVSGSSFGTFNATDDAVLPLSSITTVQQGPRLTTVAPSSQALATAQMTITAGDALFTHITGNGAPTNLYAWHMTTTSGTANTAPSGDGALRLDGAGTAPTFVGGAHVSRLSARTTGSYVINGRTNTNPSPLKTGDIILYQTGTTAARWGMVSRDFDAGNAIVDGMQLPNGTYRISKFSPQFSQVTARIGFQQGSQYLTSSSINWTQMQAGDLVLYQTGTENAQWGVVTNASTTGGTFAINGTPLTTGNGFDKIYRFSKLDSTLTQTALAFSDGFQAPLGSLTFALATSNAQNATSFDWHVVTTTGAINGSAIRFDGNGAGAPLYGTRVTMNINFANRPFVPNDNNGNNANSDFYVVMRTSSTAVANDSFSLMIAPGDMRTSSHTPLVTPTLQLSPLYTVSAAPIAPPAPTASTVAIRAAEFPLALKATSTYAPLFRVRFGTSENTKNLTSVKIHLSPSSGTPTWTTGAITSSDLADLNTDPSSGITLWKDNGDLAFNSGTDTPVTLAANPVYAVSDLALETARSFTMTAATPQAIVSGDAYFVAIRTKAAPGNNNRFRADLTATGVTTSGTSPNLGATISRDVLIDTTLPTIQSITGQPNTNTLEVTTSEPVQKVAGGSLAYVSSTDPFTFVDGGGTAQQITAIERRSDNVYSITMNGNLTDEDFDGTPATLGATTNKIADFAANVMADAPATNLLNTTRITTQTIPAATAGQLYLSQGQPVTLQAVGGTQPYGWTPFGPQDATTLTNLGLSLASNTGVISGTIPAQASGTHTFTAKLRDRAFTATVLTGAAGANPWTYQKGGYVPAVGDVVFYRNVTDAPTAMSFGIVTAAPTNATRTNQDTFRINGALLTAQKVYQMTQVRSSFPETSTIAANGNFTQALNLRVGDLVFYPTNATATTYNWGLVSTAQNIGANNPATTLRVNDNPLPAYSATGQIQLVRASEPGFYSNTAVVTVNNGAAWTINSGAYAPTAGNLVLYRNVTDAPTVMQFGVVTDAANTNQENFRINGSTLLAGKQYQISQFNFSNMQSQSLVGTNQSNFELAELDGDMLFLPTQSNGTAYNWAMVTGGDATIPANTNITGLKLNGSAVDMAWENGAGGSQILNTSSPAITLTRAFTINIAGSDGRIAGIDRVERNVGVVGTTIDSITITGVNTSFTANSTIELLNSNNVVVSTEGAATATNVRISNKASTSATNLTFGMVIGLQVAQGQYQIRVTSGNQVVSLPNAFSIGAAQAAGLNLLSPFDNATSVPVPPMLSFAPSTNANVQSYRVTVNTSSNFTGITMWDYVFPKIAPSGIPGHCSIDQCSVQYGEGRFRNIQDPNFDPSNVNTPSRPASLVPNTPYYWKVEAYSLVYTDATIGAANEVRDATRVPESKPDGGAGRAFTTTATIADSEAPDVQFISVPKATASTDLNIFARVFDRIARPNGTPALTAKVYYCNTANCTPATSANATHVGSNFFKFTIPSATIGVANTVTRYYLEATDGPNTLFTGTSTSPLSVTSTAAGVGTISGSVKKVDGTCDATIRQAVLFMEGTGFNATSSNDANCSYALNGLSSGGMVWAVKEGFEPQQLFFTLGKTDAHIRLPFNQGGGQIGGGGASGNPFVMQHFPGPDSREIPQTARIDIFFDRAMDFGTIASANMTVQEDTNGVFTDITNRGVWSYADDTTVTPARHRATWTLTGQLTLGAGKKITVVISKGVKANGVSIDAPDSFNFQSVKKFTFFTSAFAAGQCDFAAGTCNGTTISLDTYPRVMNWSLPPNIFSVPTNSPLSVNFSVDMKDNNETYNLINSVRLYEIVNGQPVDITTRAQNPAVSSVALDASNKKLAIVTLNNAFNAGRLEANKEYELKVLAAATALNGAAIGRDSISPRFRTGTGADTGAPTIIMPAANAQMTMPPFARKLFLTFNKPLRPETVSTNTVKLYQRGSSTAVSGVDVKYDNNVNVELNLTNPLTEGATYDIKATVGSSGVVGGNGVALAAETEGQTTVTRSFTVSAITGTIDAAPPRIERVDANENKIVVKFTKPMNVSENTEDSAKSVLTKNNITIKYGDEQPFPGFRPATEGTANAITNATLSFTQNNELIIDDWTTVATANIIGKKLYISFATTVEDISGTAIDSAVDPYFTQTISQDAAMTGQSPCAQGNSRCMRIGSTAVMGAAIATGEFNKPLELRGQEVKPEYMVGKPIGYAGQVEIFAHNPTAGELSSYTIRVPITKQIPAGGTFQLTFPDGFDVTGAKQRPDSPTWRDFNRDNAGTITFKCNTGIADTTVCAGGATVAGDTAGAGDATTRGGLADDGVVIVSKNTVKVYISAATRSSGTDQTDEIEFELSDIRNASREMNFSSTDNVVTISTLIGLTQLEEQPIRSLPLMIRSTGTLQITGTITAPANAANGTVRVYLEGPGFKETTSTDFNGTTTATYTFTGVQSNTNYFVRLDPSNTLGANSYVLAGGGIPVFVNSTNATVDLPLINASVGGTVLTVTITGGPANQKLDVFANSIHGQNRFSEVTLDGNGTNGAGTQLRLSNDQWFVGTGPHIPRGKFTGPPPQIASFIPPPVSVNIKSTDNPACTGGGVVNCGLALAFTATTKQIKGKVIDSTNAANVMVGAEVVASSSAQGRRFSAISTGDGSFTIDIVPGTYEVEARVMGMAPSPKQTVNVTTAAQNYLEIPGLNGGVAISPDTAATQFILKPINSALSIQGTVSDASGTPVAEMAVYGYRTDGPGFANGMTDSSGIYRLFVGPGTWKVGSFVSGFGKVEEITVTVAAESKTNQNLSAASGGRTYRKITGRVYRDANANTTYDAGEGLGNTLIKVVGGANYQNRDVTKSDGTYTLNAPDGTGYRVKAFSMDLGGELPPTAAFDVSGADVPNKDFRVSPFRTVTFTLAGGTISEGVIELRSSTGFRVSGNINNGTLPVLSVPDGSYVVEVRTLYIPFTASNIAATDVNTTTYAVAGNVGTITVNSDEGLTITIPTIRTITGTVRDANNQLIGEAGVEIFNDASHVALSTATRADGTFTLNVPNAATNYILNISKAGYVNTFQPTAVTAAVADAALTGLALTLNKGSLSIGGQVKIGATGVARAKVYAKKLGGGFAGAITDNQGNYSLSVQAGSWDVFVRTDGYVETAFAQNPVVVGSQAVTGKDVTLTQTVTANAPVSQAVSPSVGGSIEDTSSGTSLIIAANVLPTQTSTNLQIKDTQNFTDTDTSKVAGGAAKEINAEDSNGSAVTTLKGGATLQMTLTKAQLLASVSATDSSINTKTEADQLSVSFYDDVAGQWKSLPTTFTYKDATGATVNTPSEDLSNIASVQLSATTTHFSLFAPTVKTNPTAPSAPTGLAVSAPTTSSLTLTWTAVAGATGYSIYRDTAANGTFPRIGSDPTVSSGSTTSYVDTGLANNTAYFYKISAHNTNGESEASAVVTNTTSTATTSSSSGGGGSGGTAIVSGTGGSATSTSTTTTAAKPAVPATPATPATPAVPATPATPATPAVPATPATPATPAPQAASVAQALTQAKGLSTISRALTVGSKGSDVKTLQQVMKADGCYKGPIDGVLDSTDIKAVKCFQVAHKISKPGQKAFGNIGPATRAAINKIVKEAAKVQKAATPAKPAVPAKPATPATPAKPAAPVKPTKPTKEEQAAMKATEATKKKEALNAAIEKASDVLEKRYTSKDEVLGLMEGAKVAKSTAALQKKADQHVKKLTSVLESKAIKTVLRDLLLNLPEPVKKLGMDKFANALMKARKMHGNAIPQDPEGFADFVQEAMNNATGNK